MNLTTFLDTLTARLGLDDDADFDAMIAALDRLIAMTEKPASIAQVIHYAATLAATTAQHIPGSGDSADRELMCVRYTETEPTP